MSISQPTRNAVDKLAAGIKLFSMLVNANPPLTDDQAHRMAGALHDMLVCTLVDVENKHRGGVRDMGVDDDIDFIEDHGDLIEDDDALGGT